MIDGKANRIDWGRPSWDEESWAPVPLRGFRLDFEMAPDGCVRRLAEDGTPYWQQPLAHLGLGRGWGYRLASGGRIAVLEAAVIFRAFGVRQKEGAQKAARRRAQRENRRVCQAVSQADPLCRLMLEGDAEELERLHETLDKGCPWERARMGGDALGADPVLGF